MLLGKQLLMTLQRGDKAPDFSLQSTSGKKFSFHKEMRGNYCILFFYPKNFTGGCTAEVCEFRDNFSEFSNLDIPVFGISQDTIKSHLEFKAKYKLPFDLLSDPSGKVAEKYNALMPIIRFPKRITYLIDKDLNIAWIYQNMFRASDHIKAMLQKVQEFN
jgi:thioredoxin-dependent peroxiredoxin